MNILLNKVLDSKIDLLINTPNCIYSVIYENGVYCIRCNIGKFILDKHYTLDFFLHQTVIIIKNGDHVYYNSFANKIQQAWKKYRIKTARIRNDLVIHGLMERWFHKSKINFEII